MDAIHYIEDSQPPATETACGLPVRDGQIWLNGRALAGTIVMLSTTCDSCRFRLKLGQAPPEMAPDPFALIPPVLQPAPPTPEERAANEALQAKVATASADFLAGGQRLPVTGLAAPIAVAGPGLGEWRPVPAAGLVGADPSQATEREARRAGAGSAIEMAMRMIGGLGLDARDRALLAHLLLDPSLGP